MRVSTDHGLNSCAARVGAIFVLCFELFLSSRRASCAEALPAAVPTVAAPPARRPSSNHGYPREKRNYCMSINAQSQLLWRGASGFYVVFGCLCFLLFARQPNTHDDGVVATVLQYSRIHQASTTETTSNDHRHEKINYARTAQPVSPWQGAGWHPCPPGLLL